MPYFRVTALSKPFLNVICKETLTSLLDAGTIAYRVSVLSSQNRARTLLLIGRVIGKQGKRTYIEPDWFSSELEESLFHELKVESLKYVCVFDAVDDSFHPSNVDCRSSSRFIERTGFLGWKDLREEFEVFGYTESGNIVLFAKDGSKCVPRVLHDHALPNPTFEED